MKYVVLMFSPTDETTPYERAWRVSYAHTLQSVAERSIVHKFLKRSRMDQAWESINGFIVSLTSSFDQLKTYSSYH